jgi:peroxiredoxin 2/4
VEIMKKIKLFAALLLLSVSFTWAQSVGIQRIPLIGSEAPSFNAQSTMGTINFPKDFGNKWKILFAHPRDFTPICSSEILEIAYQQAEFDRLGTQLVIVSTDRLQSHESWKTALEGISFKGRDPVKINFPMVEDYAYRIVNSYGMLDSESSIGQSIRGVFFIDPENRIRAFYFYPNEVGRNIEEIKRTLVALQVNYAEKRHVLPVNWQLGEDVMLPYITQAEKDGMLLPDSDIYNLSWFMTYRKNR